MANYDTVSKKMLIKDAFYGLLLLNLHKIFTDNKSIVPTAGVRRYGIGYQIAINTPWFDSLTDEEGMAVLKHELQHIFLGHVINTFGFTNHQIANYVEDLEINQMIDGLPEGGITYDNASAKFPGIEQKAGSLYYYKYVIANLPPDNEGGTGGFGTGLPGDGDPNQGSHEGWGEIQELSDAEKELIEEATNGILVSVAEQVEKTRGTIPGCFQSKIDELLKPKPQVFNWKAYFRRLLGEAEEFFLKTTRKKPSKRFEGAAGFKHKHKHNILVAIDTSGSVSDKELADFFSEITHVHKSGAHVDIIEFDTKIHKKWRYNGKYDGSISGRGGTDFTCAIEHFNERRNYYSALIMFTDGYAPIDVKPLGRVVWVLTYNHSSQDYPGTTVVIPQYKEN